MKIVWSENDLTPEEFTELRAAVGFTAYTLPQAKRALAGGLYSLVARSEGQAVAMGRVVGDGAIHCYLEDIVVLPAWQGKGLGKQLVANLLAYLQRICLPDTRVSVGLLAATGKEPFYKSFGFEVRPRTGHGPGMDTKLSISPRGDAKEG